MTIKRLVEMEFAYIPVKQLTVVWTKSQRPYDESWAKQIADNFDNEKFDPIIVTKPNGEMVYHIVEGQHRRHAAEMYARKCNSPHPENEQVPCRIIPEADPARAAEIWIGINGGRKATTAIHAFLISVEAKREPEVTINNAVIDCGFIVHPHKSKNHIAAVSGLRTVYNRHGLHTLKNTLKVLRYLWHGDPAAVQSPMLRGFGLFLHEFSGYISQSRMITKIGGKWSPFDLHDAAVARLIKGEPLDEEISELILREYNSGMKEKLKRKTPT